MSIFGKLDAANISTNPNFVEEGDYSAEVTAAEYRKNRNDERQLFLEYTINDEDSAFNGNKVREYFTLVDESMTAEMFALMPADDKKRIRKQLGDIKRRLCGYSEERPGLGVTVDDLNDPYWDPASLKGLPVTLGISNGTGQYVNVKYATVVR